MRALIVAAAILVLAACAGVLAVADKEPGSPRVECARLAQPEVTGGHGAYGGFYREEHPYYLAPERPQTLPEERSAIADPYFNPGGEAFQLRPYRSCLLRSVPPGSG